MPRETPVTCSISRKNTGTGVLFQTFQIRVDDSPVMRAICRILEPSTPFNTLNMVSKNISEPEPQKLHHFDLEKYAFPESFHRLFPAYVNHNLSLCSYFTINKNVASHCCICHSYTFFYINLIITIGLLQLSKPIFAVTNDTVLPIGSNGAGKDSESALIAL